MARLEQTSIGTVVWNYNWGQDACFESHTTQPSCYVFDNCRGIGTLSCRSGADTEAPNHLSNLTLWNLEVTGTIDEGYYGTLLLTLNGGMRKCLVENISSYCGWNMDKQLLSQEEGQLTYEEDTGIKGYSGVVYEAQLQKRLGYVPAWLKTAEIIIIWEILPVVDALLLRNGLLPEM